jgi:16S rRNA U516 pseudouridylate synthase RsuA-like enzyme
MQASPFLPHGQNSAKCIMLLRALSKLGACSRRQAKRAIHAGRVQVNGKVVTRPTVFDLLRSLPNDNGSAPTETSWIFPVGRLDYNSEGFTSRH